MDFQITFCGLNFLWTYITVNHTVMTSNDKDQHYSVNGKIKEYTQSGDCRFLAYIPFMMEKSSLAGEGGAMGVHAHPLSAYYHLTYKVAV